MANRKRKKTEPAVLALDLATNCGWAHSCGTSGSWHLGSETGDDGWYRCERLRCWMGYVWASVGVERVVIETNTITRYRAAVRVQTELQLTVAEWCGVRQIPLARYDAKEIKRFATGKSKATKQEMVDAANDGTRAWTIDDHDEVDALWLLELDRVASENRNAGLEQ